MPLRLPSDPVSLDELWEDAFERAENGELVSFEALSSNATTEEERDALRLKYSFLMRMARAALKTTGKEMRAQRSYRGFVVRTLSVSLSGALLGTIGSVCYLSLTNAKVPEVLIAVASALVGYLVGIVTGILGISGGPTGGSGE
jgi:hypothetical protein